ncbi:MAG: hypothetical protein NBV68_03250 [Erythrobacter sp.]|uniref:hypothetical protein n=1 Tax=Erythrobacter sp. TaxID=1042 RepID=UPI0025EFE177|nr:hypothetical protein [Erythrobacter sp.]MCL9998374.1 hypothetical protein [Erythrobacter sp.]
MKPGTHNLGHNAFSDMTIVKVEAGALIIRQAGRAFSEQKITLSANQIELLKDVLA